MNLVKYNYSQGDSYIFINDIDLFSFLNFLGESTLKLISFYGYSSDRYFSKNEIQEVGTVCSLIKVLMTLGVKNINNIEFDTGIFHVTITDCYEYYIKGQSEQVQLLLKSIFEKIIDIPTFIPHLSRYQYLYLLFDDKRLLQVFSSFDEYISSDYG